MASARRTRDCRRAAFFITVTTTRVRVKDTIVLYYSILDVESGLNLHRPGMSGQSDETTSSVLTFMLLFYSFITFTGPCWFYALRKCTNKCVRHYVSVLTSVFNYFAH